MKQGKTVLKLLFLVVMQVVLIGLMMNVYATEVVVKNENDLRSNFSSAQDNTVIKLGDTIKLTQPIVLDSGRKITLDLNGYNLIRENAASAKAGIFSVQSNAELTVNDSSDTKAGGMQVNATPEAIQTNKNNDDTKCMATDSGGKIIINAGKYKAGGSCVVVGGAGSLQIEGGEFTADDFPITTNGADLTKNIITINKGTFNGCIYLASDGEYNINGGTFAAHEGKSALEIKSGNLTISGGNFTANATQVDSPEEKTVNNGKTGPFVGTIVVSKPASGYQGNVEVTISGGKFENKAGDALVMINQTSTSNHNSTVTVESKKGTVELTGNVSDYTSEATSENQVSIGEGASIKGDVTAVKSENITIDEGATVEGNVNENVNIITGAEVKEPDAKVAVEVDGKEVSRFDTIEEALAYAPEKATLKLLDSITITKATDDGHGIVIDKDITLDLAGCNITAEDGANVTNALIKVNTGKNVTITGNGTIENKKSNGEAVRNAGTLTISGGTFKGSYALTMPSNSTTNITKGTFNGCIYSNGTGNNVTLNIECEDNADVNVEGIMYLASDGKYTISGGTFDGGTGTALEIRRGSLEISGGDFKANVETSGNKDAETTVGASGPAVGVIVVAKAADAGSYAGTVDVIITGGTFTNEAGADNDAIVMNNQATDKTHTSTIEVNGDVTVSGNITYYCNDSETQTPSDNNITLTGKAAEYGINVVGEGKDDEGNNTYKTLIPTAGDTITVTWKDSGDDGKIWLIKTYDQNGTAKYDGEEPTKKSTPQESYEFEGWVVSGDASGEKIALDAEVTLKDKDVEIIAQYKATPIIYTATFIVDGETYYEVSGEYGVTIEAPADPTKDGYIFKGWEPVFEEKLTKNVEYIAQWNKEVTGGNGGGGSATTKYTITVSVGQNGSITPTGKVKVEKGEDKKFYITPNNGYVVDDVLVDGKSVGAVASYTFEKVEENHTLSATFKAADGTQTPVVDPTTGYVDVAANAWFKDAVKFVTDNKLMNGTGNNKFEPDLAITRGMLATVIYRLAGASVTTSSTFADVPATSYYSNAIAWAAENGIVTGVGENRFEPDRAITREEMATMLARFINMKADVEKEEANSQEYADASLISEYAVEAVKTMKETGLMEGKNGNNFDPKGMATRAEVATILMRFVEKTTAE